MYYYDHVNKRVCEVEPSNELATALEIMFPGFCDGRFNETQFERLIWHNECVCDAETGTAILEPLDFAARWPDKRLSFEYVTAETLQVVLLPWAFNDPIGVGEVEADAAWDLWQKLRSA